MFPEAPQTERIPVLESWPALRPQVLDGCCVCFFYRCHLIAMPLEGWAIMANKRTDRSLGDRGLSAWMRIKWIEELIKRIWVFSCQRKKLSSFVFLWEDKMRLTSSVLHNGPYQRLAYSKLNVASSNQAEWPRWWRRKCSESFDPTLVLEVYLCNFFWLTMSKRNGTTIWTWRRFFEAVNEVIVLWQPETRCCLRPLTTPAFPRCS